MFVRIYNVQQIIRAQYWFDNIGDDVNGDDDNVQPPCKDRKARVDRGRLTEDEARIESTLLY